MKKPCIRCKKEFLVTEDELSFLEKISPEINNAVLSIPLPDLCVGCREQSRVAFRNEFHFYKRKCAFSGKDIVAIYDENSSYKIYDSEIWWTDDYDPLAYGRDFDFSKTFFEQFDELNLAVPKAAIQNAKSENSLYTNYSAENKNCYICAGSSFNEDCYYCSRVVSSKFVCDSYDLMKCENCYGCLHSTLLYNCAFSKNCHSSSNLILCDNCIACQDCLGCTDLQSQRFCIFNEQYSEKEYKIKYAEVLNKLKENNFSLKVKANRKEYIVGSEDCNGNHLVNCKNCKFCFSLKESQDCRYVGLATNSKDCYDCNFMDRCELVYNSTNLIGNYRVLFAALVWYTSDSMYVMNSFNSKNLFGCTGMKRHDYCVLNKKYSKEDYHKLVEKIVNHMQETKEWGKYFPINLSAFPYNISVAQDYYPLSKEQASKRNLNWFEEKQELNNKVISENTCAVSGKPYRIIKQEKELCDLLGINLPNKCPEVRRREMTDTIVRALSNFAK